MKFYSEKDARAYYWTGFIHGALLAGFWLLFVTWIVVK
jgi:hypothetical protein